MGPADQQLLNDSTMRHTFIQALVESYKQGGSANLEEALVEARPWGFEAKEVSFEPIYLWHGEDDRVMPVGPARLLAEQLPHCRVTFYPGEGHLSIVKRYSGEIFSALKRESEQDASRTI